MNGRPTSHKAKTTLWLLLLLVKDIIGAVTTDSYDIILDDYDEIPATIVIESDDSESDHSGDLYEYEAIKFMDKLVDFDNDTECSKNVDLSVVIHSLGIDRRLTILYIKFVKAQEEA